MSASLDQGTAWIVQDQDDGAGIRGPGEGVDDVEVARRSPSRSVAAGNGLDAGPSGR